MRIISRPTLQRYIDEHSQCAEQLKYWYYQTKDAKWKTPQDVTSTFNTADPVPKDRVVFDIHHNAFRLVVKIQYNQGIVYIRWFGTHKEYNKINVSEI